MSTGVHDDDTIVSCVGHDKVAHVIHCDSLGAHELSVAISLAPQDASGRPVWVDHENMVHIEVRDNYVALVIESNASGRVEMATEVTFVPKLSKEDSVMAEDEETMVASVRNGNPPVQLVDSHVIWVDHLPIISTLGAEHEKECAVDLQDLDTMVVLVSHHYVPLPRHSDTSGAVKLTRTDTLASKFVLEDTIHIEDLDPMIASVSDYDISMLVTADAPGPTELPIL